jgi:hypothetical protein
VSDPLPLAAAAERLRGRPGRPRKAPFGHTDRHTEPPGTVRSERNAAPVKAPTPPRTPDVSSLVPLVRLLDVPSTACYLGLSTWQVRHLPDLETARVRVPLPAGRELRRVLYDVRALDMLIARWSGQP